jgi:hypothetical protein
MEALVGQNKYKNCDSSEGRMPFWIKRAIGWFALLCSLRPTHHFIKKISL